MDGYRGTALSVGASLLFGALFWLSARLEPLTGEQIFGLRMVLTVPVLSIFMLVAGEGARVREVVARLRAQPWLAGVLAACSAMLGLQLWLFVWAPVNDRALEVSLGYFLLPLTMALAGRLLYRERLTVAQALALACGAAGVLIQLVRLGGLSWPTLLVALGFPLYFAARRRFRLDHVGGLWFEMVLILPAALWLALRGSAAVSLHEGMPLLFWVLLMGLASAAALICYVLSSRHLSFSLFGLLGYVEPVLLFGVSLLLGERVGDGQMLAYVPVWLAVMILLLAGVRDLRARHRPSSS